MKKYSFGLAIVVFSFVAMSLQASAASKVSLTPTSTNLSETQTTAVQVHLDEPIIGPGPGGGAYFHLNITSSSPSRVNIAPNPVDYSNLNWFEIKTFTITALDDGVHNSSSTVTISFSVDSDSEYYNAYSGSFILNLTDINPAPVVQASGTPSVPVATLPETGQHFQLVYFLALNGLLVSLFLLRKIAQSRNL